MNNFHEFALALLAWKKGASAHDHALLFNSGGFVACARATRDTRPATGTAIVNLLQSALANNIDVTRASIYSTAAPTHACKGMARLQTRGGAIFYADGGVKAYLAERAQPGMAATLGWQYSDRVDLWSYLARGSTVSLATWAGNVKAKRYGNARYKPMANLQDSTASAATAVEALAVWTGRADSTVAKFFDPGAAGRFELVRQLGSDADRDAFFSLLAQELVYRVRGRTAQTVSTGNIGHNIGSVMVNAQWELVGWAVNTNHTNGSFHGETNAVQAYEGPLRPSLPAGGRMYTSLEPCEMCSGVIRNALASGDKRFRVFYVQKDDTLNTTALREADSPITMAAAAVKSDVRAGAFAKDLSYGAELQRRQAALVVQRGNDFKAPTTFLRHGQATDVFGLAAQQRQRVSTPVAAQAAMAAVRTMAQPHAVAEQAAERAAIRAGLTGPGRTAGQLGAYGTRDDLALLTPRSRAAQDAFTRQQLMLQPTRSAADRAVLGVQDDLDLLTLKRNFGDPALMLLARELDTLSERFRSVAQTWVDANSARLAPTEQVRILKQVTDFLARAQASCTA